MDTHIGNTGLLVKIPTNILGYTRNTRMLTHAVILSTAKDLSGSKTVDRHVDLKIFRFAQDHIVKIKI